MTTRLIIICSLFLLCISQTEVKSQTDSIPETVTDIDGNIYSTITIGTQVWMVENLKTTRYNNGDTIGTTNPATLDISGEKAPKYQWAYDGNEVNVSTYGRLYTWYTAADDRNVCPTGWHVPTGEEWQILTAFLGGADAARGKLKESGTAHWESPNSDATNDSGFTALPAGSHWGNEFLNSGRHGHWWSATEYNSEFAWRQLLRYDDNPEYYWGYAKKNIGWSVRCIKD